MKQTLRSVFCLFLALGMTFCFGCSVSGTHELTSRDGAEQIEPIAQNEDFISAQNKFSLNLFKTVFQSGSGENLLVSPSSVMLALAMTANGAAGNTQSEMLSVLCGGNNIKDLNDGLYSVYPAALLNSQNKFAKLNIANSIWIRDAEDFEVKPLAPKRAL